MPDELAADVVVGSRVRVPLGARSVEGVVLELTEEPQHDELRELEEIAGAVPASLLELAPWMAESYASTLPRALALVIPPPPPKRALRRTAPEPPPDNAGRADRRADGGRRRLPGGDRGGRSGTC